MNKSRQLQIVKMVNKILNQTVSTLKAPVPIDKIVKKMGIKVFFEELDSDLSGLIFKKDNLVAIGINSQDKSFERQRFTVAHEFGHYLLHQTQDLRVDRNDYQGTLLKLRSELSSQGIDEEEIEANFFAAEILMPRELIDKEVKKAIGKGEEADNFIERISIKFKVSKEALKYRLINLGYIR